MAIAATHLAATFNRPGYTMIDPFIYAIVTDGDLMEGVSSETASLAGHPKLGRLIYLYDDNRISIDGSTELAFTEDRGARFSAYGWQVLYVADGNDVQAVDSAIQKAKTDPRPSLIVCRTHIGFGLPTRQDTEKAHGEPPGDEELDGAKRNLDWPLEPRFFIPEDVLAHFRQAVNRGKKLEEQWKQRLEVYQAEYPELASELERRLAGRLPEGWDLELPSFPPDEKGLATRISSSKILNRLAERLPEMFGGSADLAPSNKTWIDGAPAFQADKPQGRNFHFRGTRARYGIHREWYGSLCGGLAPYGGTFLVFSDYMRPAIRLSALSKFPSIWVFTHDSIGVGEDGPTHQPVEHLAALRAIPGLVVICPGDANEVRESWIEAIARRDGPTALIFTRQNLPTLDREVYGEASGVRRGAYVLADLGEDDPELILMASGSEVSLIVSAGARLAAEGISVRLVSFPSWELFEAQPMEYRELVLPAHIHARLAVESGVAQGWERWVGGDGDVISIEKFGASAPYNVIFENYGFTVENVVARAASVLALQKEGLSHGG